MMIIGKYDGPKWRAGLFRDEEYHDSLGYTSVDTSFVNNKNKTRFGSPPYEKNATSSMIKAWFLLKLNL